MARVGKTNDGSSPSKDLRVESQIMHMMISVGRVTKLPIHW